MTESLKVTKQTDSIDFIWDKKSINQKLRTKRNLMNLILFLTENWKLSANATWLEKMAKNNNAKGSENPIKSRFFIFLPFEHFRIGLRYQRAKTSWKLKLTVSNSAIISPIGLVKSQARMTSCQAWSLERLRTGV